MPKFHITKLILPGKVIPVDFTVESPPKELRLVFHNPEFGLQSEAVFDLNSVVDHPTRHVGDEVTKA